MIEVILSTNIIVKEEVFQGIDVIRHSLRMIVITIHERNQKSLVKIKIEIGVDHVIIRNTRQMMKNVIKRKRKKVRSQGLVRGQGVRLFFLIFFFYLY